MSRYRKIDTRMWADARFMALSAPPPNAQSLWIYLLTGPHTTSIPGLFVAGRAMLAEALGWDNEGFTEASREVFDEGFPEGVTEGEARTGSKPSPMAIADWKARVVYLPNALRYNKPESPNVVKSWRLNWEEIPDCALKADAWEAMRLDLKAHGASFEAAFVASCLRPESCAKATRKPSQKPSVKTMPNQEQEQEQEQDKELAAAVANGASPSADEAESQPPKAAHRKLTEAQAEGEAWLSKARDLANVTENDWPTPKAFWPRWGTARKAYGAERLLSSLDGHANGDGFWLGKGLMPLLGDTAIQAGLAPVRAPPVRRAPSQNVGINDMYGVGKPGAFQSNLEDLP